MAVSTDLTAALKKVVLSLEDDLRDRVAALPDVDAAWRGQHSQAVSRERTAMSWQAWRDDRVTQAAVAWVLTSVFVRFCEDNRLVKPVWIAGPGERRQEALDAQLQYFRENPEHTDREWLLQAVEHFAALRATRELVGTHSPLWTVSPSGQAVQALLTFWRQTRDDGSLVWDFTDDDLSTRFLGDLYQDLSDYAKKTFALLQTPEFVEEFILDQTMEPALAERPLEGFRMIDPTCGSGHFLLGAFARLNDRWARHAPGLEPRARVQKALDAVHGVDLNPFAVAIARFRLMVAALQACEETSLEDAPGFTFHLAAGDSLLHGGHQLEIPLEGFDASSQISGFAYDTEDLTKLREILTPGRYDTVVGNPPYITVRDASAKRAYKSLYGACHGLWVLSVPFMERFFQLAKGQPEHEPAGWTGFITSNSFMKREFGTKLITKFLPTVELDLVVDSEGVWMPGHNMDGTPTVIIVGRNRRPTTSSVRTVVGKGRRESREVGANGQGPLWQRILANIQGSPFEDEWIQVAQLPRSTLANHPWTFSGTDAAELMSRIESSASPLSSYATRVGFMAMSHADDAFTFSPTQALAAQTDGVVLPRLVSGTAVRDYRISGENVTWFPYDREGTKSPAEVQSAAWRLLWPNRTELWHRSADEGNYREVGRNWWEWHQVPPDSGAHPWLIAYAEVATHNHFVADNEVRVFKQTAPIIRLPRSLPVDLIFGLAGALNSSSVCFWLKQRCKPKGGAADVPWLRTYQFNSTNVELAPIPRDVPISLGTQLADLADRLRDAVPAAVFSKTVPSQSVLPSARARYDEIVSKIRALQEELDWAMYQSYGLTGEDVTYAADPPALAQGERSFEIALARTSAEGTGTAWFSSPDQGATPITDLPSDWPADYRELVRRRLALIESDRSVSLLEKPEYKRRWATEPWDKQVERALRGWLLDRLEDRRFWFDSAGRPQVRSVAQLADDVSRDADLTSVLELWSGRKDQSVTDALGALLDTESVPFLAAHRLKDSGLRKREAWEHTWDLQRREDAGEKVGDIPVPPKYASADFRKTSWWQHRGKLDVPKERLILYPGAGRETDPTAVLGWAGWDHAQQSLALASLIQERESDGWDDDRLVPLVAGLAELQPWVRQWHDETDPTFQVNLADYLEEELRNRASQVGRTLDELAAWRPPAPTRGRRPRA